MWAYLVDIQIFKIGKQEVFLQTFTTETIQEG